VHACVCVCTVKTTHTMTKTRQINITLAVMYHKSKVMNPLWYLSVYCSPHCSLP